MQHRTVCLRFLPQGELQSIKLQLEDTKQRVDSQKTEQQKLQKIIADCDAEQIQQKKQLEQVTEERGRQAQTERLGAHCVFSEGDQRAGQPRQAAAALQ